MRALVFPLLLVLAACGKDGVPANEAVPGAASATIKAQWGSGRDRLCLMNERAGLIVYAAEGDSNCMVRGTADRTEGAIRIKPDGDESCTISATTDKGAVVLGDLSPACAYYCGPKSSYAGKRLEPTEVTKPVVDLAGEPLC